MSILLELKLAGC